MSVGELKMTDKEQIIIDGVNVESCKHYISKAVGREYDCKLGRYCKLNPNCYYKQLKAKEQECEELKRKVELMMDCPDCKVDEYKKALEEIGKVCIKDTREFADGTQIRYDSLDEILNIINKVKEENEKN